jgi:hypothetical protein
MFIMELKITLLIQFMILNNYIKKCSEMMKLLNQK